ncbi:MAG TPA: terminase family protein [Rariglobus sp.]|jgi:phage FluMu gp28-like protein|nr:terminase family protein [Rariglobus sp.]
MSAAARKVRKAIAVGAAVAAITAGTVANVVESAHGLITFRKYQERVFWDHETKTQILHWSRQVGKSYTLANWAVKRLLDHPGRLVTVLSNSRANGLEFVLKCQEVCRQLGKAIEMESNFAALDGRSDISEDMKYDMMRGEVRVTVDGQVGRILVLAANPRTARGFSGDLILDEFAFHQDSAAIWEAAEPIISSNPDYLCRIASTGNGRRNMFYQLISEGRIPYYRVRRSDAWKAGEIKIYSAVTGKEITPDEARAEASDKRAYDQNYECVFNDEASALLTQELINAAQREGVEVEEGEWSPATIARLAQFTHGELYLGQDVGRNRDLSVITVIEKIGQAYRVVAMLRMENKRLPYQQSQLKLIATLPKFRAGCIDMTGIGLGLVEYSQDEPWGRNIKGVNFGSTEPLSKRLRADGRQGETARVTELMATELLQVFEDHRIEIPMDAQLRDSLRKPERIVSPGGRVSIAATRDEAGHADEFWSVALAIRASQQLTGNFFSEVI